MNNKKVDKIFGTWINKCYIHEKVNVVKAIEIVKKKKAIPSEIMAVEKFIDDYKYEVDWQKTNAGLLVEGIGYDKQGKIVRFAGLGTFN
jgi:hypothetical protein